MALVHSSDKPSDTFDKLPPDSFGMKVRMCPDKSGMLFPGSFHTIAGIMFDKFGMPRPGSSGMKADMLSDSLGRPIRKPLDNRFHMYLGT